MGTCLLEEIYEYAVDSVWKSCCDGKTTPTRDGIRFVKVFCKSFAEVSSLKLRRGS